MLEITEFPQSVIEQIGFYVYTLTDPHTNTVFYVGKGTGNRGFAHVNEALEYPTVTDKLETIRRISRSGMAVQYDIIRHGMTEDQALEVEAALIDFVGLSDLTNRVVGQRTDERGRMSATNIVALYRSERVRIAEPGILIIVNRLYRRGMTAGDLYEITRGNWVLGDRRNKARYAFAVYRGLIREVYQIESWHRVEARDRNQKTRARWRFTGIVAESLKNYVGGNVQEYIKPGSQNPILYVNC